MSDTDIDTHLLEIINRDRLNQYVTEIGGEYLDNLPEMHPHFTEEWLLASLQEGCSTFDISVVALHDTVTEKEDFFWMLAIIQHEDPEDKYDATCQKTNMVSVAVSAMHEVRRIVDAFRALHGLPLEQG